MTMHPFLEAVADDLYARLYRSPEVLLMTDGHPGVAGDLFFARLLGHDEQVDAFWCIPYPQPVLHRPIPPKIKLNYSYDLPELPELGTADYRIQNGYAAVDMSPAMIPSDVLADLGPPKDQTHHLYRLVALTYCRETA